jgi:hypothetical protein
LSFLCPLPHLCTLRLVLERLLQSLAIRGRGQRGQRQKGQVCKKPPFQPAGSCFSVEPGVQPGLQKLGSVLRNEAIDMVRIGWSRCCPGGVARCTVRWTVKPPFHVKKIQCLPRGQREEGSRSTLRRRGDKTQMEAKCFLFRDLDVRNRKRRLSSGPGPGPTQKHAELTAALCDPVTFVASRIERRSISL